MKTVEDGNLSPADKVKKMMELLKES